MLDPPPSTFPIPKERARPLTQRLGSALNCQYLSLPMFVVHCRASATLGTSSSPPASNNRTLTAVFSARRRATTEPEEPDPQTMKSYCAFRAALNFSWFSRTRSEKASDSACLGLAFISFLKHTGEAR